MSAQPLAVGKGSEKDKAVPDKLYVLLQRPALAVIQSSLGGAELQRFIGTEVYWKFHEILRFIRLHAVGMSFFVQLLSDFYKSVQKRTDFSPTLFSRFSIDPQQPFSLSPLLCLASIQPG
jgi:hypothetical protein